MIYCESQCSPVWKTGTMRTSVVGESPWPVRLNVVRSGRPEQLMGITPWQRSLPGLNVVRSGRPEQWARVCGGAADVIVGLNVVRSGRPEQSFVYPENEEQVLKSQCSPVWKTGTIEPPRHPCRGTLKSQCSPVWKTGTMHGDPVIKIRVCSLNVVRSGRPEQLSGINEDGTPDQGVSM